MLANHRLLSLVFPLMVVAFVTCVGLSTGAGIERAAKAADPKLADGLTAWEQVYSVLTSPRCINCHTATNYPQQGDDRHRHFANVMRGPEGNRTELCELSSGNKCRQYRCTRRSQVAPRSTVYALAGRKRSTSFERSSLSRR